MREIPWWGMPMRRDIPIIVVTLAGFVGTALGRDLTIEQRMECQRAVEGVYWQHRIWPSENPGSKPSLGQVLADDALRAKVETVLRESAALEMWGRPITAESLQEEMDRIARESHRPEMLGEIVSALGDDPFLVAECLVRPILADQRIADLADRDTAFAAWWKEEASAIPLQSPWTDDVFAPIALQTTDACTNDTWTPTTQTSAPGARSGHASLWTGSEVIVYGGTTGTGYWRSGGLYDPATNAWRPLPNSPDSFSGGDGVSVVWTGTRMISWGGGYTGDFGGDNFNHGGRYDPAANTWQPTSVGFSVPSPRWQQGAVWTGTRMIVWGGNAQTVGGMDTGGVYDPVADDWHVTNLGSICQVGSNAGHGCQTDDGCPGACSGGANAGAACTTSQDCFGGCSVNSAVHCVSNTDCSSQGLGKCTSPSPGTCSGGGPGACQAGAFHPPAMANLTAVWTGSRMIVFGGAGNVGARYDPVTDTWSPTSITNAPSGQYTPGVWTGTQMIVWSNPGGRYDPATDTWSSMNMSGAPSGRTFGTSVWTGDEMIVWGGGSPSGLNTGGRYRPSTNTWTPTSTGANVPSARAAHSAAWTGSEMMVWGGFPSTNTGGRYCATSACAVSPWYRDADGDGYGVSSVSVLSCAQPPGYVAAPGDCNDAAAGIHPGIAEVCGDGIDNDCDGIADDAGALAGTAAISLTGAAGETVSWTPITGANVYDLVRGNLAVLSSSHGDFALATSTCLGNDLLGTSQSDASIPASGQGFWYLVRGANCSGPGTFDEGSASQSGSRDAEIQASGHACP